MNKLVGYHDYEEQLVGKKITHVTIDSSEQMLFITVDDGSTLGVTISDNEFYFIDEKMVDDYERAAYEDPCNILIKHGISSAKTIEEYRSMVQKRTKKNLRRQLAYLLEMQKKGEI